ncbi:MAG: DinB family protein [Rhodospirillaceae bacterium]|nr:DinB family protein [Rhodospirillales bacterium]
MTPDHFRTLARYNRWANGRLYAACGEVGQTELAVSRPSYFGSILATLNHGLVGDRLWMGRFQGAPRTDIVSLGQILHPDFEGLAAERAELDHALVAYFDDLRGDLNRVFSYRTMEGQATQSLLGWAMMHMFNHATHHRGQVHDMLSSTNVEPPALDLIYFLREG